MTYEEKIVTVTINRFREADDFNRMNLNEIIYGAPYYVFVVFDWGDK